MRNLLFFLLKQEVVYCLEKHRVMVILDNHISQPGWCCSDNDGNGFFGDKHLNPQVWIKGLKKMASMFANVSSNVVGMSLRNELRGPKQNIKDWYKYMREGAEAVHSVNPNVLVIVSGLNYATDLSFLRERPFEVSFRRKVVFEIHWYGFWNTWEGDNLNKICGKETEKMMKMSGFLLEKGIPLFVSEFGIDQRGNNANDNKFLSCFMALAADRDLDWSLWTLAGSYYIREKSIGSDESYGVLDFNWSSIRNSTILQMISAIQTPFIGTQFVFSNLLLFYMILINNKFAIFRTRANGNSTKENNVPSFNWTLHCKKIIVSTKAWFLQ